MRYNKSIRRTHFCRNKIIHKCNNRIDLDKYILKTSNHISININNLNHDYKCIIVSEYNRILTTGSNLAYCSNIEKLIHDINGNDWNKLNTKIKKPKVIIDNKKITEWNEGYEFMTSLQSENYILWMPFSDFSQDNFRNINLNNTYLMGAKFDGSDLSNILLEHSYCSNSSFTNSILDNSNLSYSTLCEVNLTRASIKDAKLYNSNITEANLTGASFNNSCLINSKFGGSNLCGADFAGSNIQGTNFTSATVDYKTRLQKWHNIESNEHILFDEKTDFTNVKLDYINVSPEIRERLERNIRKLRWNKWYESLISIKMKDDNKQLNTSDETPDAQSKKYSFILSPFIINMISKIISLLNKIILISIFISKLVLVCFTKLFWYFSDYGYSTKKVISSFLIWNLLWTVIYVIIICICPEIYSQTSGVLSTQVNEDNPLSLELILNVFIQSNIIAFYPSILGVGSSFMWSLLAFLHIGGCYLILSALITRFAVMFQKLTP